MSIGSTGGADGFSKIDLGQIEGLGAGAASEALSEAVEEAAPEVSLQKAVASKKFSAGVLEGLLHSKFPGDAEIVKPVPMEGDLDPQTIKEIEEHVASQPTPQRAQVETSEASEQPFVDGLSSEDAAGMLKEPLPSREEVQKMSKQELKHLQWRLGVRMRARQRLSKEAAGGLPTGLVTPEQAAEMDLSMAAGARLRELEAAESAEGQPRSESGVETTSPSAVDDMSEGQTNGLLDDIRQRRAELGRPLVPTPEWEQAMAKLDALETRCNERLAELEGGPPPRVDGKDDLTKLSLDELQQRRADLERGMELLDVDTPETAAMREQQARKIAAVDAEMERRILEGCDFG